jgi:Skp family chaperone for outer membrane proteins
MNKFAFGAALVALSLAVPAAAQNNQILIVDMDRVFTECTACRAASTQLQSQAQQLQQRAQQLQQPLQTEGQAIQTAVRALNGKQADAALQQRITAFQGRQSAAEQELAGRQQTLRSTQTNVNQQIATRLGPIIEQLRNSRNAAVVLDKGQTLANNASLDITAQVLQQLNQQLPSVSVTPAPAAPAGQQPQGR